MLVSSVQPVEMRTAVCCIVCSLVIFVVDSMGDHIMEIYSTIGLVEEKTFGICIVGLGCFQCICYK